MSFDALDPENLNTKDGWYQDKVSQAQKDHTDILSSHQIVDLEEIGVDDIKKLQKVLIEVLDWGVITATDGDPLREVINKLNDLLQDEVKKTEDRLISRIQGKIILCWSDYASFKVNKMNIDLDIKMGEIKKIEHEVRWIINRLDKYLK